MATLVFRDWRSAILAGFQDRWRDGARLSYSFRANLSNPSAFVRLRTARSSDACRIALSRTSAVI
jgi:hypothetical protein